MLKIKELRQEKGISQEELAIAIKVKNYNIGDWERERTEPNIENIINLANYFEVSTDYLLGRTNDIGLVQVNHELREDEIELLNVYNKLDRNYKNQVIGFAKGLLY